MHALERMRWRVFPLAARLDSVSLPKHEAAVGSADQRLNGVDDVVEQWTGASCQGHIRFANLFIIHNTYLVPGMRHLIRVRGLRLNVAYYEEIN